MMKKLYKTMWILGLVISFLSAGAVVEAKTGIVNDVIFNDVWVQDDLMVEDNARFNGVIDAQEEILYQGMPLSQYIQEQCGGVD